LPFHEALAKEMDGDAALRTKLGQLIRDRALPDCYYDHPVVKRHEGRHVLPVALYLDAVPWSQSDSVLGFWLICLVSGRRYLWAVLRKQHACRCGCRGWCSFHQIFRLGLWSTQALAEAKHPTARHDGEGWLPSDRARCALEGTAMRLLAACLYLKGDWSEFSSTVGLPSWQDSIRPCFQCNASGSDMYLCVGNTHDQLRWAENAAGDYSRACDRCSFDVFIETAEQRDQVVDKLRYDKRASGGARGRAMVVDMAELGLSSNDRLEPTPALPDIGKFESIDTPCTVKFWRTANESLARHRNPMLVSELGLDPRDCLAVDVLHAIHLGVLKVWARTATWAVLQSGVYGRTGTTDENLQIAVLAFRSQLMQFYKRRHQEDPGEQLTRVADFNVKMVGTASAPVLKTKGAETWGVALFLVWVCRHYTHRIGPEWQRLVQAGEALVRVVNILTAHKGQWVLPEAARKDSAKRRELVAWFFHPTDFSI